jgi:hypothetical protein
MLETRFRSGDFRSFPRRCSVAPVAKLSVLCGPAREQFARQLFLPLRKIRTMRRKVPSSSRL